MKKLKLEKFRVSKLNNSQSIIGGTNFKKSEDCNNTPNTTGHTQDEEKDEDLIPPCLNTSKNLNTNFI
ncbi:hypothetical protein NBT05_04040 [Aquimarina sp. ERC-38]|uniref:hypothetical protein n=1 Tax=Aquimarina sp. ERC-38 TaxID=2949996 RepID=UPI0022483FF7|nr:hypothetical protein [Aquimarina sp. ERC-38]UZO81647.1 hypothetical protein NBT05_04040 [Aquimarina sp. ERC-38]